MQYNEYLQARYLRLGKIFTNESSSISPHNSFEEVTGEFRFIVSISKKVIFFSGFQFQNTITTMMIHPVIRNMQVLRFSSSGKFGKL